MITPEARERLAELMEQRMADLRLTWREVAETGDISYEALRAARNGSGDIRRNTQAGIEAGLRWERGSVARILAGGDPVPLGGAVVTLPPAAVPRARLAEVLALRGAGRDIAGLAAIAIALSGSAVFADPAAKTAAAPTPVQLPDPPAGKGAAPAVARRRAL